MKSILAKQIKQHGVAFLDNLLKDGPVHIIKNNKPKYVVLSKKDYDALCKNEYEIYLERIKASLQDVKSKKVKKGSARELIKELHLL